MSSQVCKDGEVLIADGHEDADEFAQLMEQLQDQWRGLQDAMEARKNKLAVSERAQQYLFDASEAEAWMSEQVRPYDSLRHRQLSVANRLHA